MTANIKARQEDIDGTYNVREPNVCARKDFPSNLPELSPLMLMSKLKSKNTIHYTKHNLSLHNVVRKLIVDNGGGAKVKSLRQAVCSQRQQTGTGGFVGSCLTPAPSATTDLRSITLRRTPPRIHHTTQIPLITTTLQTFPIESTSHGMLG